MSSGRTQGPSPRLTTSRRKGLLQRAQFLPQALPDRVKTPYPCPLIPADPGPLLLAFHTAAADSAWPCRSRASFRSFLMISTDPLFSWEETLVTRWVATPEGLGHPSLSPIQGTLLNIYREGPTAWSWPARLMQTGCRYQRGLSDTPPPKLASERSLLENPVLRI